MRETTHTGTIADNTQNVAVRWTLITTVTWMTSMSVPNRSGASWPPRAWMAWRELLGMRGNGSLTADTAVSRLVKRSALNCSAIGSGGVINTRRSEMDHPDTSSPLPNVNALLDRADGMTVTLPPPSSPRLYTSMSMARVCSSKGKADTSRAVMKSARTAMRQLTCPLSRTWMKEGWARPCGYSVCVCVVVAAKGLSACG